jgi:hypothetical protein
MLWELLNIYENMCTLSVLDLQLPELSSSSNFQGAVVVVIVWWNQRISPLKFRVWITYTLRGVLICDKVFQWRNTYAQVFIQILWAYYRHISKCSIHVMPVFKFSACRFYVNEWLLLNVKWIFFSSISRREQVTFRLVRSNQRLCNWHLLLLH